MVPSDFDIVVVADDRFSGGTLAAIETEVSTFAALGARIGLLGVRSRYLNDVGDRPNPRFRALLDLDGVVPVAPGAFVRARGAFFHNPMIFFSGIEEQWGDIIPPFYYDDGGEEPAFFPGLNWDADGQAIYENDCVMPEPPAKAT